VKFDFVIKLQYPYNIVTLERLSFRIDQFHRECNQHVVTSYPKAF